MAKLQIFSRVASPLPFQSMPSLSSCSLRVGTSCSSNREHVTAATVGNASSTAVSLHSAAGGWARYTGSSRAFIERSKPRSSLLEAEAPIETQSRDTETVGADAVQTRSECFNRGCRPIYDEEAGSSTLDCESWDDEAFRLLEVRASLYASRRSTRDLEIRPTSNFPLDFAEFVNEVWNQKATAAKYFEIAMKRNPNDTEMLLQYAQFAWKTLGDFDLADDLFCRAVRLENSVLDSNVQATYAVFLWQTDV